jgi:hypothetical protein
MSIIDRPLPSVVPEGRTASYDPRHRSDLWSYAYEWGANHTKYEGNELSTFANAYADRYEDWSRACPIQVFLMGFEIHGATLPNVTDYPNHDDCPWLEAQANGDFV